MNTRKPEQGRQVRLVTIDEGSEGQRIDNFLLRELKGLPKSRIYRILRKGEVRINGRRAKPQARLQVGDEVRIPPISHLPDRDRAVGSFRDLDSLILHQDDNLLVINKPAGMAVHGGSGVNAGVIESLRHALKEPRLELVHRLDRGTSGCLMIARRRACLRRLQDALRKPGSIRKYYLALVHGHWPAELREIDQPLVTLNRAGQERFTRVANHGKPSTTRIRCLEASGGLSLVEAYPVTGRTHQIRVHARWARHPVVGDERYGAQLGDGQLKDINRLMLHAVKLDIPAMEGHPSLSVLAPPDDAFMTGLTHLPGFKLDGYLESVYKQ